ncbi:phage holin family protein [Enterococcus avium]|uniref:phage holin family protein n=1 Tax=Enterococcus avium TaxID=33945 RepID=UPI00288EC36F|nr:phage holin family protein [Enterococcus avium]MDT2394355.1 phage holin family protein [Enterococcus avium]MDT2416565.1 phage holin family protein [Enterococcus avium]MDT2431617.1 phage holin family protein [Enterococcus avium]MDT2440642.1 phage holin family protein [Enterococcus avium]MDT2453563.1 phage holin family protein [Enterococcus avium]
MEKYMNAASVFTGVLGGVVVSWLGGMDAILHALVALVIVDYLTGLLKAWHLKEINSKVGFVGLIKKVLIFVVIAISVEVEKVIGDSIPLREVMIMFYLANEGISFLENISVFINFPDQIKDVFLQIRNSGENISDKDDQENNIQ